MRQNNQNGERPRVGDTIYGDDMGVEHAAHQAAPAPRQRRVTDLEHRYNDAQADVQRLEGELRHVRRGHAAWLVVGAAIGGLAVTANEQITTFKDQTITTVQEWYAELDSPVETIKAQPITKAENDKVVAKPQAMPTVTQAVKPANLKNTLNDPLRQPTSRQVACVMDEDISWQVAKTLYIPIRDDGGYYIREQASFENTRSVMDTYDVRRLVMIGGTAEDSSELAGFYQRSETPVVIDQVADAKSVPDLGADKGRPLTASIIGALAAGEQRITFVSDAARTGRAPLPLSSLLDEVVASVESAVRRDVLPAETLARAAGANLIASGVDPCNVTP